MSNTTAPKLFSRSHALMLNTKQLSHALVSTRAKQCIAFEVVLTSTCRRVQEKWHPPADGTLLPEPHTGWCISPSVPPWLQASNESVLASSLASLLPPLRTALSTWACHSLKLLYKVYAKAWHGGALNRGKTDGAVAKLEVKIGGCRMSETFTGGGRG